MTRRVMDKKSCVPSQLRLKSMPETRDRITEGRMKPYIERRTSIPAGPHDDVSTYLSFDDVWRWTHR